MTLYINTNSNYQKERKEKKERKREEFVILGLCMKALLYIIYWDPINQPGIGL